MTGWKSELYCTAFNKGQLPPSSAPEIVMAGRSNVGKSTLINALLGYTTAKVSSKPGKTRSINFYKVNASDKDFMLVDLPGYGYAARNADERKSWLHLIDDYFKSDRKIAFVIHLIDFRHGPLKNDDELTVWLNKIDMPRLVVFTKGDKISSGKRGATYNQYLAAGIESVLPPLITCGRNGKEMDHLRSAITDVLVELKKEGM